MFDRIVHAPVKFPDRIDVNVNEKRAPTDESVRLLREMETEARRQVSIQSITRGNVFGSIVTYRREERLQSFVAFELNGEKIVAALPDVEIVTDPRGAIQVIADYIAAQIVRHAASGLAANVPGLVRP